MKHIKTYESRGEKNARFYWAFESDDLKVHKIITGPNKGKISFRFYNEDKKNYSNKCSVILGCAKVIDTKYENNEELRKIELGGRKFRKVFNNSIESIIRHFLYEKYGYEIEKMGLYLPMNKLISIFGSIFYKVMLDSDTIGDVIDKLKILQIELLKKQEEHYKKWKFENDTKKYNL